MAKTKTSEPESISGYFRKVFAENPKWLRTRSNDEVLKRWLADHPGEKEVPERVRQNLANIKSVLRKQSRKRGPKKQAQANGPAPAAKPVRRPASLEVLEEAIDECVSMARAFDRDRLAEVINQLRRARNKVVWLLGE